MSIRFTAKAHRGMVALTVAAGLALGVAGCGGGGDDGKKPKASSSAPTNRGSDPSTQEGETDGPLAEMKGSDGLLLRITSAERDSGGFLTVNGSLVNDGDKSVTVPSQVRGTRRRSFGTVGLSAAPRSWTRRARSGTTCCATPTAAR